MVQLQTQPSLVSCWNFLSKPASLPRESKLPWTFKWTLEGREFPALLTVVGDLLWSGPRTVSYSYARDIGSSSSVPSSGSLCYNFPTVKGFCSMKKKALSGDLCLFSSSGYSRYPRRHSHERVPLLSKHVPLPLLNSSRGPWRRTCK